MLLKHLPRRNFLRSGYWDFSRHFDDIDRMMDKQLKLMERDMDRMRNTFITNFDERARSLPKSDEALDQIEDLGLAKDTQEDKKDKVSSTSSSSADKKKYQRFE